MTTTRVDVPVPAVAGRHAKELKRWIEAKRGGIGGSSAAAALGLGRYDSRLRLWAEMTGQLSMLADDELSRLQAERMRWGTLLESAVLQEIARRLNGHVVKAAAMPQYALEAELVDTFRIKTGGQQLYRNRMRPWQHYSLDGMISVRGGKGVALAEVKTTGSWLEKAWTDEPPEDAFLQAQHGMAVLGLHSAYVGALIGGQMLRIFRVERDEELVQMLIRGEEEFLEFVRSNKRPPLESPVHPDTAAVLKMLHPEDDGTTVELDPAVVIPLDAEREAIKARMKEDKERLEELTTTLRAYIGDATFAVVPGADFQFSLKTIEKAAYTVKASKYRDLRRKEVT